MKNKRLMMHGDNDENDSYREFISLQEIDRYRNCQNLKRIERRSDGQMDGQTFFSWCHNRSNIKRMKVPIQKERRKYKKNQQKKGPKDYFFVHSLSFFSFDLDITYRFFRRIHF